MKNKILIVVLSISIFGCASKGMLKNLAAGSVGCLSQDVKITNEDYNLATDSNEFIAECAGKKFACLYINPKGLEAAPPPKCTEMVSQSVSHETTATGDTIDPAECLSRKRYNATLVCPTK